MAFLSESLGPMVIMHIGAALRALRDICATKTVMKPIKAAITLALAMMVLQQTAGAAEWSYCVAPSDAQNRIYISSPFPINAQSEAEPGFDNTLTEHRLNHDAVECARADNEAAAVIMRQHAVAVNRQWGRQVVDMPWRPLR